MDPADVENERGARMRDRVVREAALPQRACVGGVLSCTPVCTNNKERLSSGGVAPQGEGAVKRKDISA